MPLRSTALIAALALAVCSAADATDRPSGFEVWRTCRNDLKVVCPNAGLLNLGAVKACMKENFGQLGAQCRAVVLRYQVGRREDSRPS